MHLRRRLNSLIRSALALVFLVAGVLKLSDLNAFAQAIGDFGLLPDASLTASALVLALAEILGALLLLFKKPQGLWLILALLLIFMAALVYGIQLGLDLDCGCFGPLDGEAPLTLSGALLRDVPLFGACLWLLYQGRKPKTPAA